VVSRPSHRSLVEEGFKFADDDTCIPIKMAYSHVFDIKDRAEALFIPRLVSIEPRTCCCPRMAGLPEMLKYSIPNLPPVLDPYVDERHRDSRLRDALARIATRLGKHSREIKQAYQKGELAYHVFRERMERGERVPELFPKQGGEEQEQKKIAVVGHPYCLYDSYFNFNFLEILGNAHLSVYTQERVKREKVDQEIQKVKKDIYWSSGREILGASLHFMHSEQVDGLIYLTCFACGIDSMIEPLISHQIQENGKILYLCLMIDEHTGPAGVMTRLEAFLETIERRKSGRRIK
jgi:predicted nucleotide-binding protein (sugar kinase/HSP70/actin superfamily)